MDAHTTAAAAASETRQQRAGDPRKVMHETTKKQQHAAFVRSRGGRADDDVKVGPMRKQAAIKDARDAPREPHPAGPGEASRTACHVLVLLAH